MGNKPPRRARKSKESNSTDKVAEPGNEKAREAALKRMGKLAKTSSNKQGDENKIRTANALEKIEEAEKEKENLKPKDEQNMKPRAAASEESEKEALDDGDDKTTLKELGVQNGGTFVLTSPESD